MIDFETGNINVNNIITINKDTKYGDFLKIEDGLIINKYNDIEYYVPVTKVNNDTREKAEIIIEELSINRTYNTNLMSYLNTNAKVIAVNKKNNDMVLDFNNYIYSDSTDNEVSDEVIKQVCLSIKDNYDINSIIFTVNNKEIYKST